jgi:hypothetical protein
MAAALAVAGVLGMLFFCAVRLAACGTIAGFAGKREARLEERLRTATVAVPISDDGGHLSVLRGR